MIELEQRLDFGIDNLSPFPLTLENSNQEPIKNQEAETMD